MSSLEERREARRRRRQQEEEALVLEKTRSLSRDAVKSAVDSRLAARRMERKHRRTESPQVNHSNNTTEEDEGEKRRRERREARLRQDQERGGGEDSSVTEERSSRRSRRRGGDEDEEAPAASEPAADPEPEPAAAPVVDEVDNSAADQEAEEQRRREEEEAAAEAERQRQAEEERRRRQEEERRQVEEKRRQRTPRTPKHERQSRPKSRTPRGPLKTPRSARQQTFPFGTPSEQTIPEEEKKTLSSSGPKHSEIKTIVNDSRSKANGGVDKTEISKTVMESKESETKSNLGKRSISSLGSASDLYAKIDVKAKVKALEAERNKHLFPFTAKGAYVDSEMKPFPENDVHSTSAKRMSEEVMPQSAEVSAIRLRSMHSSSDTDFDDRLTDIVATNREMLSHDDTIERFTDFELGSCSSYDDIFPPKEQKNNQKVPTVDLMSTNEFTPDFTSNEVFQSTDSLLETQTRTVKKTDSPKTDSSSEHQPLKSILKVKTHEDNHQRESSINRHKTRSSAKERDWKRSSSRTRTRAPPLTPSDTSSDENDHFIPFSVDNEEVIYNPEKRRASALEEKAEKAAMNFNNDTKIKPCLPPKPAPGIESMSENESMFSGDDVSSTRNSTSVGTSVENLDSDYGELMSANTTLTATVDDEYREYLVNTPTSFATHGDLNDVTVNDDMTDSFISTAMFRSPGRTQRGEIDKVKVTERKDSDNSLESLESSLESSGFAGVKSDIPFNAKKKKMNARRSGRISQMTSIWSKMPDSKEDVCKESKKSSSVDPPRKIFVIKSARDEQESEETNEDPSVSRHKTIESRMTELQQQLLRDEAQRPQVENDIPNIRINEEEPSKKCKKSKMSHDDPNRYSEAKKKQLDELFGKLNSKLKSKEHDYKKKQYSDRQAPIFLAPFDSSVDAMQRSQSQPILNTNEEMEYYDPSQSVREYIYDESPVKTPEPGNYEDGLEEGDEVGSNKAQCSSGNTSSRLGSSSVSNNWSAGSNAGSDSNVDDYSESEGEYTLDNPVEHVEEPHTPRNMLRKEGKVFIRKESGFSLKSNVSDGPFQPNAAGGYIIGDVPDEEDVYERQAHTHEWLQEDVGYRQMPCHRPSNVSTLSNADSTSVASMGSLEGACGAVGDVYYPDEHYYGMDVQDGMSLGEFGEGEELGMHLGNGGVDGEEEDLKLPLHFLNDDDGDDDDDEDEYYGQHPAMGQGGEGDFFSDRCMDGSLSDEGNYGYSSDDLGDEEEEAGLDSSRIVEYGDEYFQGEEVDAVVEGVGCAEGGEGGFYDEGQDGKEENGDDIHSMDEMGEDILQYLSDEMEEEGEVEEWGEEEYEEGEADVNHDVGDDYSEGNEIMEATVVGEQVVDGGDIMEEGIIYYTPNSGGGAGIINDPQETFLPDQKHVDVHQMIHEGNEMMERNDDDVDDEDIYSTDGMMDQIDYSTSGGCTNTTGITESARRRELFKEHHGHIDDKDIVHCDNLPHGQELPDNDEFFLSFEYDEDHGQGINEDYSEDSEAIHDVELLRLEHQSLHSPRFEQCEGHNIEVLPLSPKPLQSPQYVESKTTEFISLSSENLSTTKLVEPHDVKISSQNSIEALHSHQLIDSEIPQNSETGYGVTSMDESDNQQIMNSPQSSEPNADEKSFVSVVSETDSVPSQKSNISDYDDRDIPPNLRQIRKQLVSELKVFDANKLRKTSQSTDEDDEVHPKTRDATIDNIPDIRFQIDVDAIHEATAKETNQINDLSLPTAEAKQTSNLSPIEKYIQSKQESPSDINADTERTPSATQSWENRTMKEPPLGRMEDTPSPETDTKTEFVKLRRNSSSSSREDGGVMSKERRRSIRCFWFQLDEDEKKQKENDENWRRKRDENQTRSRERHQNATVPYGINSHGNNTPHTGSMQHLDLASNVHEETTGGEISQPYEKPHKKPPPATAPKPRRKTTIGISFNADSQKDTSKNAPLPPTAPKPPKPIHGRTTSVKEIASFHEKQTEALHETKAYSKPIRFNTSAESSDLVASNNRTDNVESKFHNKDTVSFRDKLNEVLPESLKLDRIKRQQTFPQSRQSGASTALRGSIQQGATRTEPSECEETILSARSEEHRKAKVKEVERILIKRLAENTNLNETMKSTPPVVTKLGMEQGNKEFTSKIIAAVNKNKPTNAIREEDVAPLSKIHSVPKPHTEETQTQNSVISNESTLNKGSTISQNMTPLNNFNSVISPFSLNLPLNPPTLEEIDVSSNVPDDLQEEPQDRQSKDSQIKQQLWIDTPSESKDANSGKQQAPRPRFNAKALAPAQNVMPSWAKKIEVKTVTTTTYNSGDVPPLTSALSAAGSTTSLDNIGNVSVISGELSSRDKEIKSWATDYIKDVISLDHRPQLHGLEAESLGGKFTSDSDSVNTSFSANSSFYGHLPLHTSKHGDRSFMSEGQSDPLSSRSSKSREPTLSVAERISKMKEKMEASNEATKPPEKLNPTQSQKQFASLLQNRLIDVIAQEAEDDKKERERERKKKRPKHPPPNSWAAERLRLFGSGKSVIKEDTTWSPDQTSTPSTLSREPTKMTLNVEGLVTAAKSPDGPGTAVEDATTKLEDLSQSLSQNEVVTMNKVRRKEGRQYRRVTTGGINIAEMRERFAAGTDSSGGSSTESSFGTPKEKTRPNSPWISSTGAFPPSPLVSSVINRLTSAENTDTEGKSPVRSREPSLNRGRVAERVSQFSSRENSLPNSRSSSRSRRDSEVISGTFDLKTVSELVRRVESSEESGTSLGSSLSFQPGELASRCSENKLVSDTVRKLQSDQFSSSNSSPSNSLDRRTAINRSAVSGARFYQNENAVAKPFKKQDDEACSHSTEASQKLSQAVSSMTDFQPNKAAKNKRLDKDRRHTTQINFAELRERYNSMGQAKSTAPPQSPALHAIYASSLRHADSDSDNSVDDPVPRHLQVARSSTFQKTKFEPMKDQEGNAQNVKNSSNLNFTLHPQNKTTNCEVQTASLERPKDLGFAFSSSQRVTSTPCSSVVSPGSKPVSARHRDVEDDVFSPLSSARVPESLNLPSDLPPPPASFAFSATSYEDDISHGELAESESSDTVDFVKKRYEEISAERQKQRQHQQYQQQYSPPPPPPQQHTHQTTSYQQHTQHHFHQNHTNQRHQGQTPPDLHQAHNGQSSPPLPAPPSSHFSRSSTSPTSQLLGATASTQPPPPPPASLSFSSSLRHQPTFPETIIDTRTATGHVRCRILSEIPAEPDESGIGASDQSMGSNSTLSISSVIQDRGSVETRPLTSHSSNSTSSLPAAIVTESNQNQTMKIYNTENTVSNINIPDIQLPENSNDPQSSPDNAQSPIRRKFSLGNESVSSIEGASSSKFEDNNLLSPRRASVHAIQQNICYSTSSTRNAIDGHSANPSLSVDPDCSAKFNDLAESCSYQNDESYHSSSHRHDSKRRKSKSKFMQDVMEKRRNKSEPNESGTSSHSRKKHTHSSSDADGRSNGLFGTTVGGRKKSTGSPTDNETTTNTMKGYSKRFDALWAKFDPDIQQNAASGTSDLNGQSASMLPDEAEAAERARQEEEERERERMEAEEAARVKAEEEQKKKKKGKRKGLGGLSAEKKKLLKKLIMQRAAEELRNEAKQKAAEKEKYINDRVAPLKTDGLGQSELQALVKDLHARVSTLEEDVYDWEIKIRKQDFEINELTLKVNDTKGKFIKPVLRKVNKTESKLKKIQVLKESTDFRGNLKSTGQNKYALEEDEGDKNNPHWRDELKPKDKEDEEAAAES